MTLFYKRNETSEEIIICYPYNFFLYFVILGGFVVSFFLKQAESFVWAVTLVFILIYYVDTWKSGREIKKAMKNGSVKFSGSKFSIKNPIVVVINKKDMD